MKLGGRLKPAFGLEFIFARFMWYRVLFVEPATEVDVFATHGTERQMFRAL